MSLEQLLAHVAEEKRRADERTLAEVAALVRLGVGTLQSQDRSADTHRRRSTAAWVLVCHYAWTVEKTAKMLHRTERQTYRMLRGQRPNKKVSNIYDRDCDN
jgi:hypothetical protein